MRMHAERRLRSMGTAAHVVVVGRHAESQMAHALRRLGQLEQRWSRFVPASDVSRINRRRGLPTAVSCDTIELVRHATAAWRLTGGLFDPTMAAQLAAQGYDRTFDEVGASRAPTRCAPGRGCGDVIVDERLSKITMPIETQFDPGGIGKGLAADIVVRELIDDGARGVMVNIGGDLAVRGAAPSGDGWVVALHEPTVSTSVLTTVTLDNGAMATSTVSKRRWKAPGGERHHVLDPKTGTSAMAHASLASVIAGSAWWAEAMATATLVSAVEQGDVASLQVMTDGRLVRSGGFEAFES